MAVLSAVSADDDDDNGELKSLHPKLECVADNGGGSYTAFFGSQNDNDTAVDIPIGPLNKFAPPPEVPGKMWRR